MCAYMQHIHIHAPPNTHVHHQIPPKYKIYLVGLPSVLYERPGQNERCVESAVLVLFSTFLVLFMKMPLFIEKVPLFMKTNKTRSICVCTCTIYTYMHHMHHQIPPKYNIYLVGLPSVLYETPGHNERSVLNLLFLLLFSEKHSAFQWKVHEKHEKHSAFQWKAHTKDHLQGIVTHVNVLECSQGAKNKCAQYCCGLPYQA